MEITPPSGRATRREAAYNRIVDCATTLFLRDGYEQVTTQSLLQSTGLQKGGLYHHFASKQALFRASFVSLQVELAIHLASTQIDASSPWDEVEALFQAHFAFLRDHPAGGASLHRFLYRDGLSVLGWSDWIALNKEHSHAPIAAALARVAAAGALHGRSADRTGFILMAATDYLTDCAFSEDNATPDLATAEADVRYLISLYRTHSST